MSKGKAAFLSSLAIALTAQPVAAQESGLHNGFWFGFGVGSGWAHISCDICEANRNLGISGNIRLGVATSPGLLLGAEVNGWVKSEESVDELLGSLSVVAYWYPNSSGGLYLKAGVGAIGYRISSEEEESITSTAIGPELGIGYEVQIAEKFSLSPYLQALISPPTAELKYEGETQIADVSLSLFQLGLALTWH